MRDTTRGEKRRGERPTTFREYLARLKRDGSGLLVTGETPEWVQQHASRQLFGTTRPGTDESPRRRIVVRTDPEFDPAGYLPTGTQVSDEHVRVVTHSRPTRSAAATTAPTDHAGPVVADDLVTLTETVSETVADLATAGEPVEPAELRVGVTSVLPLVEANGLESVVEFCAEVADCVREYDGMAHVHCPLADTDQRLVEFRPHVDARVELRQQDSNPVQCRWHTPYPELNLELGWVDFL